jgi:uncharacterized membrane protein (DUF373 family)
MANDLTYEYFEYGLMGLVFVIGLGIVLFILGWVIYQVRECLREAHERRQAAHQMI